MNWAPFVSRVESEFGATVAKIEYERLSSDPAESVFEALHEKLGYKVDVAQIAAAVKAVKLSSSERPESKALTARLREALQRRSENDAR